MIPIAPDHPLELADAFGRGVEIPVLIDHQHAQPIAGVEELFRRRIVRRAPGIRAHLLGFAEAEVPQRIGDSDAYPGMVLMVADTLEFERAIIEKKTLVGIEANRAKAAAGFDFVGDRSIV